MAIVAGVDFGTLSVRVTLFDSERAGRKGGLGTASAEYPLKRKREDPDFATQSHQDQMDALVHGNAGGAGEGGDSGEQVEAIALDTTGSSVIPVDDGMQPLDDYYLWCDHRAKGRRRRSPSSRIARILKRLTGAAGSIRTNGDLPSCCIGCGTIRRSAGSLRLRLNTATWWRRRCAAITDPRR